MSGQIQQTYSSGLPGGTGLITGPIAATPFTGLPGGVATALWVQTALASGATLTLLNGSTVVVGNHTAGTRIPIKCTAVAIAGTGALIPLA